MLKFICIVIISFVISGSTGSTIKSPDVVNFENTDGESMNKRSLSSNETNTSELHLKRRAVCGASLYCWKKYCDGTYGSQMWCWIGQSGSTQMCWYHSSCNDSWPCTSECKVSNYPIWTWNSLNSSKWKLIISVVFSINKLTNIYVFYFNEII